MESGKSMWVYPRDNPLEISSLVLAYIGDAVFELYIRMSLVAQGRSRVNDLHRQASEQVRAVNQAELLKRLEPLLNEEERDVARRGRNAKSGSLPKNVEMATYRISTGFEALLGYLFIARREDRIKDLLDYLFNKETNEDKKEKNRT